LISPQKEIEMILPLKWVFQKSQKSLKKMGFSFAPPPSRHKISKSLNNILSPFWLNKLKLFLFFFGKNLKKSNRPRRVKNFRTNIFPLGQ